MSLTDLYVAATLARTPAKQREEVEADLRAAIADAIDTRLAELEADHPDSGSPSATEAVNRADAPDRASAVETTVLTEMGDPDRLAADYADSPLMLIGPRLYLQWKRLTVTLLWIVLPIIAVLIPVGMWLGDDADSFLEYAGTTLGGTLTVGVHLVFWVTLVFAVMERSGTQPDELSESWTVERLKESADVRVSGVDTGVALGALAVVAVVIVWQQVWPWATSASGEGLPAINPDLWSFMLPALLAVMAIEAVAVIVRQVRGRWTVGDCWLTLALNVATVALFVGPVSQHRFLNRELADALGWPDANTTVTLDQLEWLMLLVIAAVSVADVWGSWSRARRSRLG